MLVIGHVYRARLKKKKAMKNYIHEASGRNDKKR